MPAVLEGEDEVGVLVELELACAEERGPEGVGGVEGFGESVLMVGVEFLVQRAGGDDGGAGVRDVAGGDDGFQSHERIFIGDLGFEESEGVGELAVARPGGEGAGGVGADARVGVAEEGL